MNLQQEIGMKAFKMYKNYESTPVITNEEMLKSIGMAAELQNIAARASIIDFNKMGIIYLLENISKYVCEYLQVDARLLMVRNRRKEIVVARQICMYLMRQFTKNLTVTKIGEYFNKDHTTVLYSIESVENISKYDTDFRLKLQNITQYVKTKMA